jgi:hypothetical protein
MKDRIAKAVGMYTGKIEKQADSSVNVEKQEVFNVSEGETSVPVSVSFYRNDENVEIDMEGNDDVFVLDIVREDNWTPIASIVSMDESLENDYVNIVEKLKSNTSIDELRNMAKEIESKYSQKAEAKTEDIGIGIEAHTLTELIRTGHTDAIPGILAKEGWAQDTIDSYMSNIIKKKDEVK